MARTSHKISFNLILGLCFGLIIVTTSCGGDTIDGNCVKTGEKLINIIGNSSRTVNPGNQEQLQVGFFEKCVGPVSGETITFELNCNGCDSSLSAGSVMSGPSGLAEVTLMAGTVPQGTTSLAFTVWAHSQRDPLGKYFTINLAPENLQLRAVDGTSKNGFVSQQHALNVQLVNVDTSQTVPDVNVQFVVEGNCGTVNGNLSYQTLTGFSGLASATFVPTEAGFCKVIASGANQQIGSEEFTINTSACVSCENQEPCPDGQVCNGTCCVPQACQQCSGSADSCPEGMACVDNCCKSGLSCDPPACPEGFFCEAHRCYPECNDCDVDRPCSNTYHECIHGCCVPPSVNVPNVNGKWYTTHYFKLEYKMEKLHQFIGWLQDVLVYCEITGVGVVDDFLCSVIDQYVPEWVIAVVNIFASISDIMSELRAEGELVLEHLDPKSMVSAHETWTTILLNYEKACCEDGDTDCNPRNQEGYPECAFIDISREELSFGGVDMTAEPFVANIVDDGIGGYKFVVNERKINLQFKNFVGFVVEMLLQMFTGYDTLDEALQDIIDCEAVGDFVEGIVSSLANEAEAICNEFKPNAGDIVGGLLDQIQVEWSALNVHGEATITVSGDDAYEMGFPDYLQSKDGSWEGTFKTIGTRDVNGSWFGER
jgi:hypothetical protein